MRAGPGSAPAPSGLRSAFRVSASHGPATTLDHTGSASALSSPATAAPASNRIASAKLSPSRAASFRACSKRSISRRSRSFTAGSRVGAIDRARMPNPSSSGVKRGSPAISPHRQTGMPARLAASVVIAISRSTAGCSGL